MSKSTKPILDLRQFMLKQEVKTLYRKIFKTIRLVNDPFYENELKQWTRLGFRTNAGQTDQVSIKMSIKYGERCLRELETSLSLAK